MTVVCRGHFQGGGVGGLYDNIEFYASLIDSFIEFLDASLLSFDAIMINNAFLPLILSHHFFRRFISLFFCFAHQVLCRIYIKSST